MTIPAPLAIPRGLQCHPSPDLDWPYHLGLPALTVHLVGGKPKDNEIRSEPGSLVPAVAPHGQSPAPLVWPKPKPFQAARMELMVGRRLSICFYSLTHLPCPAYPALPYPALPCPTLPNPALPCPTLSYPALPSPVLPLLSPGLL